MKFRSKAIAAIAAGVSAAALLTGCGSSSNTSPDGSTKLTWSIWVGSAAETAVWQHLADMVHDQNPSITVSLVTTSFADYWTKIPPMLTTPDAPCIVTENSGYLSQIQQLVTPLNSKLSALGVDPADFAPGIYNALAKDGNQLGVPFDSGPRIVYYNKDAFAAAGLPEPKVGWPISEFEADAKKLTQNGKYGFAVNSQPTTASLFGQTIAGAELAKPDGKLNADSPEMLETLQWYAGLVNKDHVSAPLSADQTGTPDQAQYLAGNAAMYQGGAFDLINVQKNAKFKVGVATLPVGSHGLQIPESGSGFGISKKCVNPDAAAKALAVLTSPAALSYLGDVGRSFPARLASRAGFYKNAVPGFEEVVKATDQAAVPLYTTPTWAADTQEWMQGVVGVVNGTTDAKSFLSNLQANSGSK